MRNMTGSPIAGIDPHEFLDVRQLNKGESMPCQMHLDLLSLCPCSCADRHLLSADLCILQLPVSSTAWLGLSRFSVTSSCLSMARWSFAVHPSL